MKDPVAISQCSAKSRNFLPASDLSLAPILNTITLDKCVASKQINIYKFIF